MKSLLTRISCSKGPTRIQSRRTTILTTVDTAWRKRVLPAILLVAAACLDPVYMPPPAPFSEDVTRENAVPGTPSWDAGLAENVDSLIAGYVLPFSVEAGDTLRLYVRSRAPSVAVRMLRLGWYGSVGAREVDSAT